MELFEAIKKRHSYRGTFQDVEVPREALEKIVQAGIDAPSAKNEQVVSFVIVDDPILLGKIGELIDRPVMKTAKAMVACVTDPRPVFQGLSFEAEDCAAAVENMLLAVTALGYASVWLDGVLRFHDLDQKVGELLGVPESSIVRILLPIGVPYEEITETAKLPFAKRAWFNSYEG